MKIVINRDYAGYRLNQKWAIIASHMCVDWDSITMRTHSQLIKEIETGEYDNTNLAVVTIPDKATDYEIYDYHGFESVIYVLNGKIHWAKAE